MGPAPVVGDVALVPFPFSDLSTAKLRPAVVVALAEHGDVVLCQILSRCYASAIAMSIAQTDFATGGLHRASYARPDKLFTASPAVFRRPVGRLSPTKTRELREKVLRLFRV